MVPSRSFRSGLGGYDVSVSPASPTGDDFYDAGTTLAATTGYTWGLVGNDTRQNLSSFTLDSAITNVARGASGNFTTPEITFTAPHTLFFTSVTQYLVTLQFKDSTGADTISPTTVEIELDDPAIVTVPPSGTWLDNGTSFQLYKIEWEGVDVMPANQTVYTVTAPLNQTVLDRVYNGNILVTDYLGLPVSGAEVSITLDNGTTLIATTDSSGYVALNQIPIGNYTATVSYLGTTSSFRGDAASPTTAHAEVFASYATIGIMVVFAPVVAAVLIAVRRRQGGIQVPSPPPSSAGQLRARRTASLWTSSVRSAGPSTLGPRTLARSAEKQP